MVATAICAFIVIPIFSSHADLSAKEVFKTVGLNLLLRNYFPPSDVLLGDRSTVPSGVFRLNFGATLDLRCLELCGF